MQIQMQLAKEQTRVNKSQRTSVTDYGPSTETFQLTQLLYIINNFIFNIILNIKINKDIFNYTEFKW